MGFFKTEVREITSTYCKQKASEMKNEIKILENKLKKLSEIQTIPQHIQQEINNIENKLENLYKDEAKGAQVRSRVKWIEEGERNTKFFLGLEKSRQTKKNISALKNQQGKIVKDSSEILKLEKAFYENLYKSTEPNLQEIKHYINGTEIDHKLSQEESKTLGGELTIEECTKAIFSMKLNKSPGLDGLSVDFIVLFGQV